MVIREEIVIHGGWEGFPHYKAYPAPCEFRQEPQLQMHSCLPSIHWMHSTFPSSADSTSKTQTTAAVALAYTLAMLQPFHSPEVQ